MHEYSEFLPVRNSSDKLDVVSLLCHVFDNQDRRELFTFNGKQWHAEQIKAEVVKARGFWNKMVQCGGVRLQ